MNWLKPYSRFWMLLLALTGAIGLKAQPPVVAINEICAINNSIAADPAGEFDDWVELYNNTGATIDLGEYWLSDDHANPMKWMFPDSTLIPSGGYLIVWCDNDTFQAGVHAFFRLSGAGEQMMISDPSGSVIDSITYGAQMGDTTFGRYPNGYGAFVNMLPTHASDNSPGFTATEGPIASSLLVYPNPAITSFRIDFPQAYSGPINLVSMSGQIVGSRMVSQPTIIEWDVANLPTGVYRIVGPGIPSTPILVQR
jgi:hypothetical protein